jgi:endonuclease YncB( thermonuclease family)
MWWNVKISLARGALRVAVTGDFRCLFRGVVEADLVTVDCYGRTVSFVKVGGTVVNEELMRQGLARVFSRYCDRSVWEGWDSKL